MSQVEEFDLYQLTEPLQNWFLGHARILPWRENPSPYYVWISEIMLQQTRVEAVKPYFQRFIETLPDVKSLAECPEDTYLKLWEGLGYYNRVRNLHQAAVTIMEEFHGKIPEDYETLLTLKGIGSYTAGAISSIAYGHPVPAVDGNVLRVISRVTGDDSDILKQSVKSSMEKRIREVMEQSPSLLPRVYNQALMELGAMVCLPNGAPHCQECPWKFCCRGLEEDRIDQLPVKKKAKARRIEERTVLLIRDQEKVALGKRPKQGLLAGLYEFPNTLGFLNYEELLAYVEKLGYHPIHIKKLEEAKHIFSHVEWHMQGYEILVESLEFSDETGKESAWQLFSLEEVREKLAVPSAFAAYKRLL